MSKDTEIDYSATYRLIGVDMVDQNVVKYPTPKIGSKWRHEAGHVLTFEGTYISVGLGMMFKFSEYLGSNFNFTKDQLSCLEEIKDTEPEKTVKIGSKWECKKRLDIYEITLVDSGYVMLEGLGHGRRESVRLPDLVKWYKPVPSTFAATIPASSNATYLPPCQQDPKIGSKWKHKNDSQGVYELVELKTKRAIVMRCKNSAYAPDDSYYMFSTMQWFDPIDDDSDRKTPVLPVSPYVPPRCPTCNNRTRDINGGHIFSDDVDPCNKKKVTEWAKNPPKLVLSMGQRKGPAYEKYYRTILRAAKPGANELTEADRDRIAQESMDVFV